MKKTVPLSSEKTIKPSLKMVSILKNFSQVEPHCEEWKLFKYLSLSFPVIASSLFTNCFRYVSIRECLNEDNVTRKMCKFN